MNRQRLATLLAAYFVALVFSASMLRHHIALAAPSEPVTVRTFWKDGVRVERVVLRDAGGTWAKRADGAAPVDEVVVGQAPIAIGKTFFPYGLVAGRDGVSATLDGKTAYATVDDLLSKQAYDHASTFFDASFGVGTHRAAVMHLLATDLGVGVKELEQRADFRRLRFERRVPNAPPDPPRITADTLTAEQAREAIRQGALYLARGVDENGRYRYLVDATTNQALSGYNWPRHAGSTYFFAQAAALLDDPTIRYACLRAASYLRDGAMKRCGEHRCIADDVDADVGSNALALVAFSEIVRTGADPAYATAAADLAAFLRSQQRADGELMHIYDRQAERPVDIQLMYFTGEAALGLSRAHRVTADPRDLEAARRALARLSGDGWSFFGSRYYFGEEHWTCQAAADLWDRAPDEQALTFCLRWHEWQRRLQREDGDSPFDAEGAFGVGPVTSPRVTPASSRGEAAAAALDVLLRERRAGRSTHDDQIPLIEQQLRRSAAFVVRNQLLPGNATGAFHLFAEPEAVRGAFPGSPVDWQLRIDYVQHAGSMLVAYLDVVEDGERGRAR